jgi:hypothetical protein
MLEATGYLAGLHQRQCWALPQFGNFILVSAGLLHFNGNGPAAAAQRLSTSTTRMVVGSTSTTSFCTMVYFTVLASGTWAKARSGRM